uniref:Uncharacterized protein n=1 Tax=Trichogramma kaykai TaxID=54128 RepID=A0ABD2XJW6_9HYME
MAEDEQNCLKKLKILREEVCWEVEVARHEILDRFEHLIRNGTGKLPNLRDTFQPEEIDWLLIIDAFNKVKTSGVPLIEFVIRTGYKDEPELDKDGKPLFNRTTPIHRAAKTLKPSINETISKLFEIYNKFDVNYIDESGLTHFNVACMSDCYEVVKKFLKLNKSLAQNLVDPPLLLTLYSNHFTTVAQLLLRSGANPNVADAEGLTPLHIIGEKDNIFDDYFAKLFFKICDELCQPVQVNARDKKGRTPLHLSISKGNEKLTRFLLKKGADLELVTDDGLNPLHIVCKSDDIFLHYREEMVSLIFEVNNDKNQLVNAVDKLGRTPLQWAVANFLSVIVDVILDHGADLSNFVFPTEDYFAQRHKLEYTLGMVVFPTMSIVESLKKKGYILDQNAALMIMKFFAENGLIDESVDISECLLKDEELVSFAKKQIVSQSMSIYDFLQLPPEKAEKFFTLENYLEFTYRISHLPDESHRAYVKYLCETVSRGFFRDWALKLFSEKTCSWLPKPYCEMLIMQLKIKGLWNICMVSVGENTQWLDSVRTDYMKKHYIKKGTLY